MEYMYLEDCCSILDSMRVPITSSDRIEGPYPYYGANGIQDYVSDYLFDDELVLLAEDGGNFGSKDRPIAYRVSGKCWVNNHAHVLKPKEIIDVDYLCYALMFYNTDGLVNGATRQKLTQATMRRMHIPKRSMNEQHLIVEKLHSITMIVEARRQELDSLDSLIKARFVEMFGNPFNERRPAKWCQRPLRELAESISDGSNVDKTLYKSHDEVLFLRIQNVWSNELRLEDSVYISRAENEHYKDTSLKHGDLLITKIGRFYTADSSLGRVSVYLGDDDRANYSNNIMRVRFKSVVNSEYVNALLNLDDYNKYIRRTSVGGTDKRALSKGLIGSFPVIVPPMERQQDFVDYLHQVDKSKVVVQKALKKAQQLFDSLMQEYFG